MTPSPRAAARPLARALFALVTLCLILDRPAGAQLPVTVSPHGVLTSLPEEGLRLVGEPSLHLREPFGEWFGIAFDGPVGRVEAVGAGAQTDWAMRPVVRMKHADMASDSATLSVTMAGSLEIRHEWHVLEGGRALWLVVILKNRGYETIRNVTYTREWMLPDASGRTWPADAEVRPAPPNLQRVAWTPRDLPYKGSAAKLFVFQPDTQDGSLPPVDLFTTLWTSIDFPGGLPLGATNGISFGDYDADGWADLYSNESGLLWRNVAGTTWELGADLNALLTPSNIRYGASFGDFDSDGLPDIITEPRNVGVGLDRCTHLLKNLGGGAFADISLDPQLFDADGCDLDAESACWGDVDGDGNMDAFMPAYPPWAVFPGPGNLFLLNLGPGPTGYAFTDFTAQAGLGNPPGSSRPEGAQFCDYDGDGDLDLFSNGTLYQNTSLFGTTSFADVSDEAGVQFQDALDEGTLFMDHDMDGDLDLVVSYLEPSIGNRIYENRGDGTYVLTDPSIITNHFTGVGLGLSAEDWDNDGDMDLSTRQFFRKNLLMESGQATFWFFNHEMDFNHLSAATPAYADWDKDGDLDFAIGNWLEDGHFYDNGLYDENTPDADKRHVRIRVVRDSQTVSNGTETEYGAVVELVVRGPADDGRRRRKFLASSHGYLNQNEYTLHFALPADPFPANPGKDVEFDVVVDFIGRTDQGFWRVDRHVNPALGGIDLADLTDREIQVWRSGKVRRDGSTQNVSTTAWPRLETLNHGLALPAPGAPLPPVTAAPGADWFVGVEFGTERAFGPVSLREIHLDGRLDVPAACAAPGFNVALWDVTDAVPGLVDKLTLSTLPGNDRTVFPTDIALDPGRRYRLVAKVTSLRDSPLGDQTLAAPLGLQGGLSYTDTAPCSGAAMAAAPLNGTAIPLTVRYNARASETWQDLGQGLSGVLGVPALQGLGTLAPSTPMELRLSLGKPNGFGWLLVGLSELSAPFYGGVLVPTTDVIIPSLPLNAAGALNISALWPTGVPGGFALWMQYWIGDPAAIQGFSASNAIKATTP